MDTGSVRLQRIWALLCHRGQQTQTHRANELNNVVRHELTPGWWFFAPPCPEYFWEGVLSS